MNKMGTNDSKVGRDALRKTCYKGFLNDDVSFDPQGDLENANYDWMIITNKQFFIKK
jgi:hypothetical protein